MSEECQEWVLLLVFVAFGYNSTPPLGTDLSPFFLQHGRRAVLPVQRCLHKSRLDLESEKRLFRMWKARVHVYEKHSEQEEACKQWLRDSKALDFVGTFVVKLKLGRN